MKKYLVFLVAVLSIASLSGCIEKITDEPADTTLTETPVAETTADLSPGDELRQEIENIISEELNNTTISDIAINENMGADNGSYIVLPYLVWDVKNEPSTTREMLEMYSDHLAAKLVEYNVSEVTVFWEVPYHIDGNNAVKMSYEREGDGMAVIERWYDPVIRE